MTDYYTNSDVEKILAVAKEWAGQEALGKLEWLISASKVHINVSGVEPEALIFNEVKNLMDINGTLAFLACSQNCDFVFDGLKLNKYRSCGDLVNIGGKLAYFARNGKGDLGELPNSLIIDRKVIGEYSNMCYHLIDVGGKPAFISDGVNGGVIYDGQVVGRSAFRIRELASIAGKLAYVNENCGPKNTCVFFDGKQIGGGYDFAWDLTEFDGELGFVAKSGNQQFAVIGGKNLPRKEKYTIMGIKNIGGLPICLTRYKGKSFVLAGGHQIGKSYPAAKSDDNLIENITDVGGKVAFTVNMYSPNITTVVLDGNEVISGEGCARDLIDVSGKLAFALSKDEITSVYLDGKKLGSYTHAGSLTNINGKLAYIANNDKEGSFVILDGQEISPKAFNYTCLTNVGGKLAYVKYEKWKEGKIVFMEKEFELPTLYELKVDDWAEHNLPEKGIAAMLEVFSSIKPINY